MSLKLQIDSLVAIKAIVPELLLCVYFLHFNKELP